jgi:hypothetical protein
VTGLGSVAWVGGAGGVVLRAGFLVRRVKAAARRAKRATPGLRVRAWWARPRVSGRRNLPPGRRPGELRAARVARLAARRVVNLARARDSGRRTPPNGRRANARARERVARATLRARPPARRAKLLTRAGVTARPALLTRSPTLLRAAVTRERMEGFDLRVRPGVGWARPVTRLPARWATVLTRRAERDAQPRARARGRANLPARRARWVGEWARPPRPVGEPTAARRRCITPTGRRGRPRRRPRARATTPTTPRAIGVAIHPRGKTAATAINPATGTGARASHKTVLEERAGRFLARAGGLSPTGDAGAPAGCWLLSVIAWPFVCLPGTCAVELSPSL